MKKRYSLDYTIYSDKDRLAAVNDILNNLDYTPSSSDLETFASYILYGKKEEDDQNLVQNKTITDDYGRRYRTWVSKNARNESLDAILENPLAAEQDLITMEEKYIYVKKRRTIRRPKYDKDGNLLDPGDSDIPGMTDLWESIDRLQHTIAVNEGKVPLDMDVPIIESTYRLYQLRHNLIDLRANQYFLLDAYRPTLHFLSLTQPRPQTYNWDTDSYYWISREEWQRKLDNSYNPRFSRNIADYRVRTNPNTGEEEVRWLVRQHHFDWTNYKHVQALIHLYSAIYEQLWDKPDSWGRTLIFDFDRYAAMANLSPSREYMLLRRIDGEQPDIIAEEVAAKFGINYSISHMSAILGSEIPRRIAEAAQKYHLLLDAPAYNRKTCYTCKRSLPRTSLFWAKNRDRRDGWASNCKECETKKRYAKQIGGGGDGRFKDKKMSKVQAGKA